MTHRSAVDYSSEENNTYDTISGQESGLYHWSSFTETVQLVESDSSQTHNSFTSEIDSQQNSSSSFSTLFDRSHEGYTEDEFESPTEDDSTISTEHSSTNSSVERARDDFLSQKLNVLTGKKTRSLKSTTCIPQLIEQNHYSQKYHENKIKLLNEKKYIQEDYNDVREKPSTCMDSKSYPMLLKNTRRIEQLKTENLIFRIDKETASPLHQPSKCKECRQLQSMLSKGNYIQKKTAHLRKAQFYKDLEEHLYKKDSATLIANIINSGPKPSDHPEEIWDRLLRRGKFS